MPWTYNSAETRSLDSSRSHWMWPEAVLCVHSVFGSSSIYTALIVVPLQRRVLVRCLYHYSQEHLVVYMYSLATAHNSGVKFVYLLKGPGAYELPNSADFLTILSDGDVSRLKLYIAWCQGMFLQWLTWLCFNRTDLNAPLPLLVAHVATPDGTHQESMSNWRQTNLPANFRVNA